MAILEEVVVDDEEDPEGWVGANRKLPLVHELEDGDDDRGADVPLGPWTTTLDSCTMGFGPGSKWVDNKWLARNPEIEFIDPLLKPLTVDPEGVDKAWLSTRAMDESEHDRACPLVTP